MSNNALCHSLSGGTETDTRDCDPVKTTRTSPYRPWQEIAADKKAQQIARIPQEWLIRDNDLLQTATPDLRPLAEASGILSTHELEITGGQYDATALLAEVASGRLTAVQVVTAFCKRAAVAQQACNCLTEIMFADAIAAAEKLDEAYVKTGKTVGPLHGLPMSFKVAKCWLRLLLATESTGSSHTNIWKECFHVKGYDAADGYISRAFDPSTTDSHIVSVVKAAGAVVIVSRFPI